MAKRKEDPLQAEDAHDKLELMPLGAGNEVGRSCVFMSYKGKNVLFDCGIHPACSTQASLGCPSLVTCLLSIPFPPTQSPSTASNPLPPHPTLFALPVRLWHSPRLLGHRRAALL
ncbi:unnamed protein product [Closterium sp. NIES-65]|nr:unnamed protein product [Closterium sp. NIES-65]